MAKLGIDNKTDVKKALDAALLSGFLAETALFPVIKPGDILDIPQNIPSAPLPENYSPAEKTGPLWQTDFRRKKGLENLLSEGMFLKDTDYDFLPDRIDAKLSLPENADVYVIASACNLAYRLGMETTGIEGSISADEHYTGKLISFTGVGEPEIVFSEDENVIINGEGERLFTFISSLCNTFPMVDPFHTWRDVLLDMTDDLCFRSPEGQLAYLDAFGKKGTLYASPGLSEAQMSHFPEAVFRNHRSGRAVWTKTYNYPWEAEEFLRIFEEEILPSVGANDELILEGAVSEDMAVRLEMLEKAASLTESKGAFLKNSHIYCAYKQGFSWITEEVIPLLQGKNVDRITIRFKPFLPEGETEWQDENGATPSYHNVGGGDSEKWYDLPIRYLQELYPIEDVLAESLGIERNNIIFALYEGDEDISYQIEINNEYFIHKVRCSERPYMDDFPKLGKVHPTAGYIKATLNGKVIFDADLKTDLEAIWDTYQREILPSVRDYIEGRFSHISPSHQPFFNKLELEVSVSEPDYRLLSREDMISSLDAFHEDLYFVGGDYFKNYGIEKHGELFDAPGLILPVIHSKKGAPQFKATLYEQLSQEPYLEIDGNIAVRPRGRDTVKLWIERISYSGELAVDIRVQGVDDCVVASYSRLIGEGIINRGSGVIRFISENGGIFTAKPHKNALKKTKTMADVDIHEKELIGYDMYLNIVEELKKVGGVEVIETARSYAGRQLHALWLRPESEGYLSLTKRLTRLPSLYINARHHANEVSSTNAALMLLKTLLTDGKYRNINDKMNIIIVPMENVDGTAIHYELQKEHPTWKLHVARFNSIGNEFYREHFVSDTIHTEAMGLTRLFERFIPDILIDNHGVPSHEWDQQFSGYTSPSYKGFWLPRSLLYGYYWYVTNDEYKSNYYVNKLMEDVIADKIASIPEMAQLNAVWSRQFEKYAHSWMPKLFPADYYKGMIDYWIPFAFDSSHRYPSIRFPWLTSVSYTSEVADETAQGEYLNLCARAHAAHDEATIDMLMHSCFAFERRLESTEKGISARYLRHRPMITEKKHP